MSILCVIATLPAPASTNEELLQHGGDDLWGYFVGLTLQDALLRVLDEVSQGPRRPAHEREALPALKDERGCLYSRRPLNRQRTASPRRMVS